MKVINGTAILTITKEDSKWVPFFVDFEHVSGGYENVQEDFDLLSTDTLPCPDAAYDLEVGETVTVEVDYELVFTKDYFGECDVELSYNRQTLTENHNETKNGK